MPARSAATMAPSSQTKEDAMSSNVRSARNLRAPFFVADDDPAADQPAAAEAAPGKPHQPLLLTVEIEARARRARDAAFAGLLSRWLQRRRP